MGLFFNRKNKQQPQPLTREQQQKLAKQQELAEARQKWLKIAEPVVVQFTREISFLRGVYKTAYLEVGVEYCPADEIDIRASLFMDMGVIVGTFANTIDDRFLTTKTIIALASIAHHIVKRVAPNTPLARNWAQFMELCKAGVAACGRKLGLPRTLMVMHQYDEAHGTLNAYIVAEMFLAFAQLLNASKVIEGEQLLEIKTVLAQPLKAYISLLNEYIATKSSRHTVEESPHTLKAYEALSAQPDCTDEELKEAYHQKVKEWHPDKFHAAQIPIEMKDLATREMARINEAYEELKETRGLEKKKGQTAQPDDGNQ